MTFWQEFVRYLQMKKFKSSELQPIIFAKVMFTLSKRLIYLDSSQKLWLFYEEEFFKLGGRANLYYCAPKVLPILLKSFFAANRQEVLLADLENSYRDIQLDSHRVAEFITKMMFEVPKLIGFGRSAKKDIRVILKTYSKEDQDQIILGVMESWFNKYLKRSYPEGPVYKSFIELVTSSKYNTDEAVKEEGVGDSSDEKDLLITADNEKDLDVEIVVPELNKTFDNNAEISIEEEPSSKLVNSHL